MKKKKKDNIKFVDISSYRGAKAAIKYFATGSRYKLSSYYRRRKIKGFMDRLRSNMSKKEKMSLVNDFKKYMGIKKTNGRISQHRKKTTIRREGDSSYLVAVRGRGGKSRVSTASLGGNAGYGGPVIDGRAAWSEMRPVLDEYNVVAYFTDFASDIYPDWVERVKTAIANYVLAEVDSLSGRQFINLCIELKNKYGL